MIAIISPFIITVQNAYNSSIQTNNIVKYYDLSKYHYSVTNNSNCPHEEYVENCKKIYEILDANGATYVDSQNLMIYYTMGGNPWGDPFIPVICVNKNYLQDYDITLKDGNILDLNKIKNKTYLVPPKYKDEDYNKYFFLEEYESLLVKEGMNYYNPSISDGYTFIEDPVILFIDGYNDLAIPWYPNTFFSEDEAMNNLFKEAGLDDGYAIYDTSQWVNSMKNQYKKDVIEAVGTLVIYTLMILVFLYQSVYLYMKEKKKVISVQYLLGYNRFKRYRKMIGMNIIPYGIVFIIAIIFLKISVFTVLCFIIPYSLVELFFMYYMIRKFEITTVVAVLMGNRKWFLCGKYKQLKCWFLF